MPDLSLREIRERQERQIIGPWGTLSENSRGRSILEAEDKLRTCFQRDVDRVTHSKAFRRLRHKTQVFLQPEGDHYRTRLTHTLEVARVARTISRALSLNEDLAEAIALGHDLGHTPFGHAGERAIREVTGRFHHYEQSLRVVDRLEKGGRGLNLCHETRMGILNHTTGQPRDTLEADAVRLADHIAYLNHDLDDAERAGIVAPEDVPAIIRERVGVRNSQRLNAMVTDVVEQSGQGEIRFSPAMGEAYDAFMRFMYEAVYRNPTAKGEESKVKDLLAPVLEYYAAHGDRLPDEYQAIAEAEGPMRAAADYVSGMTDGFAIATFENLFIPKSWSIK
ncbi:MAG: deoxyguanosinetriphosphate triphosphohydrolase [Oscillospiraceae bacterium]|nr:deoxyguanosinetriphosphate triphosphohydrolase [Oscillospiraceae bacterium]